MPMSMRDSKRRTVAAALLMAMLSPVLAQTETQTIARSPIVDARLIVTQVCAACHGADGNSIGGAIPSLAQQGADYLYDQLLQFAAQGHRRANGVMGAMAVNLTPQEMRSLADYFSYQTLKPTPPDMSSTTRGKSIYLGGIPGKNVPACASCHGSGAEGLAPAFPRLAGQHAPYIVIQLRQFRSGSRASDPRALMRTLSAKMSDAEMDAVAHYVAGLR